MNVSTDLRAAADLIEEEGWVQNLAYDGKGRRCMVQAIQVATGVYEHRKNWHKNMHDAEWQTKSVAIDEQYRQAIRAVQSALGRTSIPDWNDEVGRTKEEVVTALRGTADIWDAAQAADKGTLARVLVANPDLVPSVPRDQELVSA